MSTAYELVTLRGGVVLPIVAIRMALDLEQRGIKLWLDHDGTLLAGPRESLTAADVSNIRQHREALKGVIRYCNSEVVS